MEGGVSWINRESIVDLLGKRGDRGGCGWTDGVRGDIHRVCKCVGGV